MDKFVSVLAVMGFAYAVSATGAEASRDGRYGVADAVSGKTAATHEAFANDKRMERDPQIAFAGGLGGDAIRA